MLSRHELAIEREDDVVIVRRKVRTLAHDRGLDSFATAGITTAASELARNVFAHARRGSAAIEELTDGPRNGLRLTFRDDGPGIADLERALAGGYSTARSLGLGLSGSRRLVDEFQIESVVGRGTVVVVTKWTRF
ncbi:MAG TPA: ATP-binding protein [Kofleriaceae bacterium]|nr:ATP-binding protein [Kofleriaceae bacterium]